MSVEAFYISDRDGLEKALSNPETMVFSTKAEADQRDKMLEFAEEMREFLISKVEGLSEEMAEKCSIALAENRELLKQAVKKPELLNASSKDAESE